MVNALCPRLFQWVVPAAFGIDPIQYGIVLIIRDGVSPPISVGMFFTCSIADTTMENATPHMLPYLVAR